MIRLGVEKTIQLIILKIALKTIYIFVFWNFSATSEENVFYFLIYKIFITHPDRILVINVDDEIKSYKTEKRKFEKDKYETPENYRNETPNYL